MAGSFNKSYIHKGGNFIQKKPNQTKILLYWLLSLFNLCLGSYFVYRVVRQYDFRTYVVVLDIVVAIILFRQSIDYVIKRKLTDKQRIKYWKTKQRPKGFLYFIIFNGVIKWGIPYGFLFWVADTRNKFHPISTGLIFLLGCSLSGIYLVRMEWNSNKQKAKEDGF